MRLIDTSASPASAAMSRQARSNDSSLTTYASLPLARIT